MFGTLADFDALVAEAHRLGLKVIIDQVLSHTSDQHPWFSESRVEPRQPQGRLVCLGRPASPTARRPTTGCRSSAARPGSGTRGARSTTCTISWPSSPTSTSTTARCRTRCSTPCASGWSAASTASASTRSTSTSTTQGSRDNPPAADATTRPRRRRSTRTTSRSTSHDKSQPENLDFLQRLRALLDEYPARTTVGEVGDEQRSLEIMADYTSGGDKLHMCYTFDFLSPSFTAATFPRAHRGLRGDRRRRLALLGVLQPRRRRATSRAGRSATALGPDQLAKLAAGAAAVAARLGLPLSGRGTRPDRGRARLRGPADPYGIRFWPEFKGRDGCRTPMVWEANAPNGGFSTGKPWLPVAGGAHRPRRQSRRPATPARCSRTIAALLAFRRAHPGAAQRGDRLCRRAGGRARLHPR